MKKFLVIGIILMVLLLFLMNKQYNDAVDTCINNGQSRQICEEGLR